jgi:hypothetical protein
MVGFTQQDEVKLEDIIGQPESGGEEGELEAGPSNVPTTEKRETTHFDIPAQAARGIYSLTAHSRWGAGAPGLLGCVEKLRYAYHDVSDTIKFPEFAQQVYMESLGTGPLGDLVLQAKQWIIGLVNTWILHLLEIPHFDRGKDVNNCVKQLLVVLHGGFLWMDRLCPSMSS